MVEVFYHVKLLLTPLKAGTLYFLGGCNVPRFPLDSIRSEPIVLSTKFLPSGEFERDVVLQGLDLTLGETFFS